MRCVAAASSARLKSAPSVPPPVGSHRVASTLPLRRRCRSSEELRAAWRTCVRHAVFLQREAVTEEVAAEEDERVVRAAVDALQVLVQRRRRLGPHDLGVARADTLEAVARDACDGRSSSVRVQSARRGPGPRVITRPQNRGRRVKARRRRTDEAMRWARRHGHGSPGVGGRTAKQCDRLLLHACERRELRLAGQRVTLLRARRRRGGFFVWGPPALRGLHSPNAVRLWHSVCARRATPHETRARLPCSSHLGARERHAAAFQPPIELGVARAMLGEGEAVTHKIAVDVDVRVHLHPALDLVRVEALEVRPQRLLRVVPSLPLEARPLRLEPLHRRDGAAHVPHAKEHERMRPDQRVHLRDPRRGGCGGHGGDGGPPWCGHIGERCDGGGLAEDEAHARGVAAGCALRAVAAVVARVLECEPVHRIRAVRRRRLGRSAGRGRRREQANDDPPAVAEDGPLQPASLTYQLRRVMRERALRAVERVHERLGNLLRVRARVANDRKGVRKRPRRSGDGLCVGKDEVVRVAHTRWTAVMEKAGVFAPAE
eukprot:5878602-Prymnesium_polylepis.6